MKLLCATVALFAAGSLADDADWKESVAVLDGDSFDKFRAENTPALVMVRSRAPHHAAMLCATLHRHDFLAWPPPHSPASSLRGASSPRFPVLCCLMHQNGR